MRKNILFLSLLCGLSMFAISCDDEDSQLMPPPVEVSDADGDNASITTQLAWKETTKTVAFLNDAKDIPATLYLNRLGNTNTETVTAKLNILSQEELDAYNTTNQKSYVMLPAEYYTLANEIKVSSAAKKQEITMIVKSSIGAVDLNKQQYVIPIRIASTDCEVKAGADVIMVLLSATTPVFALSESGEIGIQESTPGEAINDEITLNVNLNVDNRWASTLLFVTDETRLNELVEAYKLTSGKENIKLLPASCYSIDEDGKIAFAADEEGSKDFKVNVNIGNDMAKGEYVLPIALDKCEGMPFLVDKKVAYLRYSVLVPTFSLKETGIQTEIELLGDDEVEKELTLSLNVKNKWDAQISFVTDGLQTLVDNYNSANSTDYTLLPAADYTLNDVDFSETDLQELKFNVTLKEVDLTPGTRYLLPVALKSYTSSSDILEVNTEDICYLLIYVSPMRKITLDSSMLETNNWENSQWGKLPISNLVDGYYWGGNDAESNKEDLSGYWCTAWNSTQTFDATYGIYIDIKNVSNLNLTTSAQFIMHASSKKEPTAAPKDIVIYTSTDGNTWTAVTEKITFEQPANKTINAIRKGKTVKEDIAIKEYITPKFTVSSETQRIRISILTNHYGNDLTKAGKTLLDELYMLGY